MSGGNTSAHQLGWPDSGTSMRDMVDNARKIVLTVQIPVFADADTGYGDAISTHYTVREYANTSTVSARARPRARGGRKSKTVAGRQGRALGDRSADPVCQKCSDPHGCPGRRDSREHQGVGLDDAGAGGRGWRPDCGPRQDT